MEPWTILGSLLLGFVAGSGARAADPIRERHALLRAHLSTFSTRVGSLATVPVADQRVLMQEVVDLLETRFRPWLGWSERVVYPLVDRKSGGGGGVTASMRHGCRIAERWMDELGDEAARPQPDPRAFGRRALNLLGFLHAHLEEEDEVLLPILDRTMRVDEVLASIGIA